MFVDAVVGDGAVGCGKCVVVVVVVVVVQTVRSYVING